MSSDVSVGLIVRNMSTGEVLLSVRADSQSWPGLTQVTAHGGVKPADQEKAKKARKNVRWFALLREAKEELGSRFAALFTRSRIQELEVVSRVRKPGKDITTYRMDVAADEATLIKPNPKEIREIVRVDRVKAGTIKTKDEAGIRDKKDKVPTNTIAMFKDERDVVWRVLGVSTAAAAPHDMHPAAAPVPAPAPLPEISPYDTPPGGWNEPIPPSLLRTTTPAEWPPRDELVPNPGPPESTLIDAVSRFEKAHPLTQPISTPPLPRREDREPPAPIPATEPELDKEGGVSDDPAERVAD